MNFVIKKPLRLGAAACLALVVLFSAGHLPGQVPWLPGPAPTPHDQRNLLGVVGQEVQWLRNATGTAPNYGSGGYGIVRNQFDRVRLAYSTFTRSLTPRQLDLGANDLAELDAGLDIIQEAFMVCENDVANGRSNNSALRSMCQVISRASAIWLQELNKDSVRLRVGFP